MEKDFCVNPQESARRGYHPSTRQPKWSNKRGELTEKACSGASVAWSKRRLFGSGNGNASWVRDLSKRHKENGQVRRESLWGKREGEKRGGGGGGVRDQKNIPSRWTETQAVMDNRVALSVNESGNKGPVSRRAVLDEDQCSLGIKETENLGRGGKGRWGTSKRHFLGGMRAEGAE